MDEVQTRADAMLAELQGQREQMANRAAVLAAELALAKKEIESLKAQSGKGSRKRPDTPDGSANSESPDSAKVAD